MGRQKGDAVNTAKLVAARSSVKLISRMAEYQNQSWGRLLMAVVERAVLDLSSSENRHSAIIWFDTCDNNNIVVALDLDGDAVRRILRQAGLYGETSSVDPEQWTDLAA